MLVTSRTKKRLQELRYERKLEKEAFRSGEVIIHKASFIKGVIVKPNYYICCVTGCCGQGEHQNGWIVRMENMEIINLMDSEMVKA